MESLKLYFHGIKVTVISNCPRVLEYLARDFEVFCASSDHVEQSIEINAQQGEFDRSLIRGLPFLVHLGGKAFGWGDERWVDYGSALLQYRASQQTGRVQAPEFSPLYHYTYYLIISTLGVAMDRMGMHRFHSVGIVCHGQSALLTMPVGGGKSTLAMQLLDDPDVSLISEDTPLIGARGMVLPFPIRISLRETHRFSISEDRFRIKNDPVFGKKFLLDLSHFGLSRCLTKEMPTHFIFRAYKTDLEFPEILAEPRWKSLLRLLISIGLGQDCPQRAEMVLRLSPAGIWEVANTLWRRLNSAFGLWRRAECYRFMMTTDIRKNAEFLKAFLAKR